jgi:hypothetical protein
MSDKNLLPVAPADLREIWLQIRAEVATVEAPEGLLPEDVYASCRSAEATLFLLMVDGQRIGWMVLRKLGYDLHVWLLYAKPGYDPLALFEQEMMEMARRADTRKITFGSARRGWEKYALKHGCRVRMVVYERDVAPA